MEMPQRNIAIDILKLLAVFLVMNSHMGICYPKYGFLATGGAIGDALFFFASGFTLFLGRNLRFDNWYKRRISRIYPSIIVAAVFAELIWNINDSLGDVLLAKRYWFVGCILVYYIFLYPIKRYLKENYIRYVFVGWGLCLVVIYFIFFNNHRPFYADGYFRCLAYFLVMLQGAMIGRKHNQYSFKAKYLVLLIISIVSWYGLFYIGKNNWLILLSFIPLLGITKSIYVVCCAPCFSRLYQSKIIGQVIYIISQLCLEVYLIQKFVFTDTLNYLFPLNVPIIMLGVVVVAYIVKVTSNLFLQTFQSESYSWKSILIYRK